MRKILIIDDDPLVLTTLARLLRKKNFAVETAGSGEEGIQKAEADFFHLVIADVRMPGIGGIETVRRIQANEKESGKKTSFFFVTGYAKADDPQLAASLGVTDFIQKPFDLDVLLAAIERNLAVFIS